MLATQLDGLSLIPGINMVEGKLTFKRSPLKPPGSHTGEREEEKEKNAEVYMCTHMHIYFQFTIASVFCMHAYIMPIESPGMGLQIGVSHHGCARN